MLYIMRHGKTDWNINHKLQGKTDVPLNAEGRAMAAKAAEEYAGINFDVCYCSPLSRATETARIFLKDKNVPIIPDERLTEMGFGVYEGAENSFPSNEGAMKLFFSDPPSYIPPEGGESFSQLFERAGDFLKKVALPQSLDGKTVLIVGHGALNSCIACIVKGLPLEKFWSENIENCKLVKLI